MRINSINNINFKQRKITKKDVDDFVKYTFAGLLGATNGAMIDKITNSTKKSSPMICIGMTLGMLAPAIYEDINEKHKKQFKIAINTIEAAFIGGLFSSLTNKIKKIPSILIFASSAFLISNLYEAYKQKQIDK